MSTIAVSPPSRRGRRAPGAALLAGRVARVAGLAALAATVLVGVAASLAIGSIGLPLGDVVRALVAFDDSDAHAIVTDLRVPRTLVALAVGLSLGACGALMQGLTRNPLADPGLLGVNGGAALGVVLAIFLLGVQDPTGYVWFALAGAAGAALVVHGLGSSGRDGATPVKIALAGAVVASLLAAITSAVLVLDAETLDRFRFWVVGSVAGRPLDVLAATLPFMATGGVVALGAGRWLNALALGDDLARTLGQRLATVRATTAVGAVALAAGAVAAAGPIAFVGLIAPHVARALTGPDYRWILPYSALIGAILLLAGDVLGRVVARPGEVEVGIVSAFVGAPVFIALVRRRRLVEL